MPATVKLVAFPVIRSPKAFAPVAVPVVAGQMVREAVVALQRAGFQVRLVGHTRVRSTAPSAGDSLPHGAVVTIYADSMP